MPSIPPPAPMHRAAALPAAAAFVPRTKRHVAWPATNNNRELGRTLALPDALQAGIALARSRADHSAATEPLFVDAFASSLCQASPDASRGPDAAATAALDAIATHYIDGQLLTALGIVNMDLRQEYRQAVLLGPGLDTRPHRRACLHHSAPLLP